MNVPDGQTHIVTPWAPVRVKSRINSVFVGIPRITGTMDVFDSYPAVLCAYTVGIYKKNSSWLFKNYFSEWAWEWDRGEPKWRCGNGERKQTTTSIL